jgi:hypothetical protein
MSNSDHHEERLTLLPIYGALFFSVPSHGMDVHAIVGMVQELPSRYTMNLLDEQVGYHLRNKQQEDFCKAFPFENSKIVSFFELEKTPTVIQVTQ